jgi:pimeloyl-ACP methyl ester carboxylesterase
MHAGPRENVAGHQPVAGGAAGGAFAVERVRLGDVELEYVVRGAGEPVLLVHASFLADWFAPLMVEPCLVERYRLISYHRVGYAGSSRSPVPVSVAEQAGHAQALLAHLGVGRAHVVGHSFGGNIALQLALKTPGLVGSLALLEPAVMVAPADAELGARVSGPAFQRYLAGDTAGALDILLRGLVDPDWRAFAERVLPTGAVAQLAADAEHIFSVELPSAGQWHLSREDAGRVGQPVLLVLGSESHRVTPAYPQRHERLLGWLPQARGFILPGATHLLQVQNPRALAEALTGFFAAHPLSTATTR